MAAPALGPSLADRLRYRLDGFMSRGGLSTFLALMSLFFLAFLLMGLLRLIASVFMPDDSAVQLTDQLWRTFLQITDAGAIAEDGDAGWLEKATGILTILSGLVLFSSLVAFITAEFEERLGELKKGRSAVIERDHTVILGAGDRVVEVVRELIVANESERRAVVAVLASTPKDELDDFFAERVPDRRSTVLITRSGNTSSLQTLRRMGIAQARSVLILNEAPASASPEEHARADARVLKAIMAVVASMEGGPPPPLVAELHLDRSRALAHSVAGDRVTTLAERELLAKLLVQTSRTSGLAVVYSNLVGFTGNEIYFFRPEAGWGGRSVGQLAFHFPEAMPIGLRKPGGEIQLNPPVNLIPADADELIVIAEDDSTIGYRTEPVGASTLTADLLPDRRADRAEERHLLVGWSAKGELIVQEYAGFLPDGSRIDVLVAEGSQEVQQQVEALGRAHPTLHIALVEADVRDGEALRLAQPESYDNVILLAEEGESPEEVDAGTLALLLGFRKHFRDLEAHSGEPVRTQLITEVMDSDNTELVLRSGVKDFLISNQFVSKILAQVSQEPGVMAVYDQLFQPDGSEIYVKPVELYFGALPTTLPFADIVRMAQHRAEVCLGVKIKADEQEAERNFGVTIIPDRGRSFTLREGDALIVLAEDET